MNKVLIVSPNWPPIACPDMQRVRMAIPFFEQFDWKPLILKINPNEQEGIKDLQLMKTIPDHLATWKAGCIKRKWASFIGLKNVGLRSFFNLADLGSKIIISEKPNLVFFSTTMFPLMTLGRYWFWKHNVPYILDFQDPWVNDYYKEGNTTSTPPGGGLKYGFSQTLANTLEPFTLRKASHVISVSQGYVDTFLKRYDWLTPEQFTVLPFGAAEKDFELLPSLNIQQTFFDPHDGKQHWVYVGVLGNPFKMVLSALCQGLQKLKQNNSNLYNNLRLHFIGTDYAPGDLARKTVEPIAQSYGVGEIIKEYPHRIPYFQALQCLKDAHGLIVPGSDDPSYTASKIYPYILAQKPLLAIFHEQSSVVKVVRQTNSGRVITFKTGDDINSIADQINQFLQQENLLTSPDTHWDAFLPFTAREMTKKICAIFDRAIM